MVVGNISREDLPGWEAANKDLFTKELDNIWEEPLFVVHISAYYLHKLILKDALKVKITPEILLQLLRRFKDLASSFASVSDRDTDVLTIAPFADQTRFLYANRLFVGLACVACFKFEKLPDEACSLFKDSTELYKNALLPPISVHSL
eukprot:CAMPEP_0206196264 /NCGR_PEP_ID=MMETSP0166-20121206/8339_1 /ASSEMBLY_ACC=CAM_ASM_000260 /TAXON_ID=95228 /ORGANISM="Vannella robusta, Strain DIVA3 518/3/11/1/6" /LENGTH=147 /DNA_ID=CAMNT_0053613695 /DNA_START=334 /DNA_END=777 /DNA_ORIENTATION=+